MPYTNSLHQNHYVLARLDVVNAKALYAHELRATEPIIDANNYVALWQAWHPLLEREKAVANDIILGEEYQAIVITGPNTGGKTILLKTVGVIQLMAQMGLYIPAGEIAEWESLRRFSQILEMNNRLSKTYRHSHLICRISCLF